MEEIKLLRIYVLLWPVSLTQQWKEDERYVATKQIEKGLCAQLKRRRESFLKIHAWWVK